MRIRAPLLLCLLVTGCSYAWDDSHFEANIVRPGNFTAGSGMIESVGVLPGARTPGTGADAKGARPDRMDVGGFQTVDIDSSRFLAGQAVDLTNDGRVVLVSGTSFNEAFKK